MPLGGPARGTRPRSRSTRRRAKLVLVAGGATAALAGGAIARDRLGRHGPEGLPPDEAIFTAYAPGGRYGYWVNGPIGWVMARLMPIMEPKVYAKVAETLALVPEDDLLDVGCGPGAFLATQARHVRRVVGLDLSNVMLRAAERRLADRIAAGTAHLVVASAATLPFGDGEFSAVSAIFAPASPREAFRALRPGGRFVWTDPSPAKTPAHRTASSGAIRWGEADYRRMLEEAGFADVGVTMGNLGILGDYLLATGRKPTATREEPPPPEGQ